MPLVSINMASSLDGKIATKKRGPVKLGSNYDFKRMQEIRAMQDLVICGAGTFRAHPVPLTVREPQLLQERQAAGLSAQPISAIVSSRLNLPRSNPYVQAATIERWIFCGAKAPKSAITFWEKKGIRVIRGRNTIPSAKEIYRYWEKVALRNVLMEGGGELNASFLEANLVDRIYLTLCPILVGGAESPSFFEGKGFRPGKFPKFRLMESRPVGDELYLIYENCKRRP